MKIETLEFRRDFQKVIFGPIISFKQSIQSLRQKLDDSPSALSQYIVAKIH